MFPYFDNYSKTIFSRFWLIEALRHFWATIPKRELTFGLWDGHFWGSYWDILSLNTPQMRRKQCTLWSTFSGTLNFLLLIFHTSLNSFFFTLEMFLLTKLVGKTSTSYCPLFYHAISNLNPSPLRFTPFRLLPHSWPLIFTHPLISLVFPFY